MRIGVTFFQLIQSHGRMPMHFVWSRTATWWAFRTFTRGWDDTTQRPETRFHECALFCCFAHSRSFFFFFIYLVVGEDTNQHWDLLDRPEWPCLRKCLGVEWWESFYTVPIVCNTVTTPVSENNSFNLHNQHKRVIIVHSSIYWSLTKIISPLSDTGCKASLITGVMILGKTVVRWSDITLDSGMTRTAV